MSRYVRRFAGSLLNLYCADCDHVIWAWQGRCGLRHTTCAHGSILRSWRVNRDATGGPAGPWACGWCHRIPSTEARP